MLRFSLEPRRITWVLAALLAACIALVAVGNVMALSVTASPVVFPQVILDGADQVIFGSTSAWRVDADGETSGWHVTVASTDFTNGSGGVISASLLEIRLPTSNITTVSGDPTGPVSEQPAYAPFVVSALKIVSAGFGTGDGVYDITPEFRLTVPAETYVGNYAAIITVEIAAGP